MMLSVIIPVLNEAPNLERLLPDLRDKCPEAEVIVVDGGSTDRTLQVLERFPFARPVRSPQGRARQMNAGAHEAQGEILLFLHADTLLPHGASEAIREALADPRIVGGRFDINLESSRLAIQVIAIFMNLRSRLTRIATGDQAIFVRQKIFAEMGGYPNIPLMEDVEYTKRLKRRGRIASLSLRVTASARKWEEEGVLRTVFLMWTLRLLYFWRVSPSRLYRLYYGHPPSTE
ncbi:MAG: TIGR04283 family arsenosugar biosynthesis glycosyltransferase [Candidatus Methylomirabilales bacterium]